jgi:hypothetical protein
MADIRLKVGTVPVRHTSDGELLNLRGFRDGSLVTMPQLQALIFEGRGFLAYAGTEDAPIDVETAIDDTTGFLLIDVATGTTVLPFFAQGVMGVWQDGTLLNFMIEVDNAKTRYSSAGTVFTPINLRSDAPIASTSTVYRSADAGILTLAAKTSGGSIELYRESIEVNLGNAGDHQVVHEWRPDNPPYLIGPAAFIVHFGQTSGGTEPTAYGSMQWVEVPTSSIV